MKNIILRCVIVAALACGVSAPAFAQNLKLTMQDGRVTLIADNVPVRQILQEWARIGQTTIVNADKLIGPANPAMTIQLVNAPEREVLDILLRSAAGYIAAPRPAVVAGASVYDRVTIMATSRPPAATAATTSVPTFQRPPPPVDDGDDPINVSTPPQPMQNPVTMQFPGMIPNPNPNQNQMPNTATQPGPLTSPRPGALPQPPMPMVIPNPYQPGQVIRPGQPIVPGGPGGPGGGGGVD
jgi:hypothetical protein